MSLVSLIGSTGFADAIENGEIYSIQVDASYLLKNGDVFDVQAASGIDQHESRAARKAARKAARQQQGAQQDISGVDAATKPSNSKPDSQLGSKALSSPQAKQSADC